MNKLKVVTWNIRQGGKRSIRQIVESLIACQADIIVLTEYRNNDAGDFLISTLMREGWHYTHASVRSDKENSVLILSKLVLELRSPPFSTQAGSHRWNEVYLPSLQLFLLGVHIPNVNETYSKDFFWKNLLDYAYQKKNDHAIIIGDFNSTRRDENKKSPQRYSNFIMKLMEIGWADAWKRMNKNDMEYSWYSHKNNGFRLDYLFLSPDLSDNLETCDFSHHEREKNFSDHSLLSASLDMSQSG